MKPFKYRRLTALLTFGAISGIGTSVGSGNEAYAADTPVVGVSRQALDLEDLARQCGFACPGDEGENGVVIKTLAEGNAAVSGIPSVDGFFNSVLSFQVAAKSVATGINAELEGIRGDFGLAATGDVGALLKAELDAKLEGGFKLQVQPPECKADLQAEFRAAAECDAKVTAGMLSVQCEGGCEAKIDVPECGVDAELYCTVQAPEVACMGECTGSCSVELDAAAACNGTCHGSCDGTCSAYVKNADGEAECAGSCSGMCTGSCDVEVSAEASCMGKCRGECKVKKEGMANCKGGLKAECRGKAGASIECKTKCNSEFEPPKVDVKCEAKVQADAKLSVQCTPPRVALQYRLKASANADLKARIRFESALKSLIKVRLPALKAAIARSASVGDAGNDLATAAEGAFKGAIEEARADAELDVKFLFGMKCASEQIGSVKGIITTSTKAVTDAVSAAGKVESALKI
jgi:hypothetical protein